MKSVSPKQFVNCAILSSSHKKNRTGKTILEPIKSKRLFSMQMASLEIGFFVDGAYKIDHNVSEMLAVVSCLICTRKIQNLQHYLFKQRNKKSIKRNLKKKCIYAS